MMILLNGDATPASPATSGGGVVPVAPYGAVPVLYAAPGPTPPPPPSPNRNGATASGGSATCCGAAASPVAATSGAAPVLSVAPGSGVTAPAASATRPNYWIPVGVVILAIVLLLVFARRR